MVHALHISSSLIRTRMHVMTPLNMQLPPVSRHSKPTDQQKQTVRPGAVANYTIQNLFSLLINFLLSRYSKIHFRKKSRLQTILYRTSSSQHPRTLFLFIFRSLSLPPSPFKILSNERALLSLLLPVVYQNTVHTFCLR